MSKVLFEIPSKSEKIINLDGLQEAKKFLIKLQDLSSQNSNNISSHDNFSILKIREQIQKDEYFSEINLLLSMIESPETFKHAFIVRLQQRQNNSEVIGFHQDINDIVNKLYLTIIIEVFEIKNIQELVPFILPKTHIFLSIIEIEDDELPVDPRKLSKIELEQIAKEKADSYLIEPIDIQKLSPDDIEKMSKNLSDYLILDDAIFDISAFIKLNLSLSAHIKFYDYLQNKHPNLATALYNRNQFFRTLKLQIQAVKQKSLMSPKEAIENLIVALKKSGTTQTGKDEAESSGSIALNDFLIYLNLIPVTLKTTLYSLAGKEQHLEYVIETHLRKNNDCVEVAANWLKDILNMNSKNSCLTVRPLLKDDNFSELKEMKQPLVAEQEINLFDLPSTPKKKILSRISISINEELLGLLLNIPTELYEDFLTHVNFSNYKGDLQKLIDAQWFNETQETALKDLTKKLKKPTKRLRKAIAEKNISNFKKALEEIPQEQRFNLLLKSTFPDFNALLHCICAEESALNDKQQDLFVLAALDSLTPEEQYLAITTPIQHYYRPKTLIHYLSSIKSPLALESVLASLPEDKIMTAIRTRGALGNLPLHIACNTKNGVAITNLLSYYPNDTEKLEALETTNFFALTPITELFRDIHRETYNPVSDIESLTAILESLDSDAAKLQVLNTLLYNNQSILALYQGSKDPDIEKFLETQVMPILIRNDLFPPKLENFESVLNKSENCRLYLTQKKNDGLINDRSIIETIFDLPLDDPKTQDYLRTLLKHLSYEDTALVLVHLRAHNGFINSMAKEPLSAVHQIIRRHLYDKTTEEAIKDGSYAAAGQILTVLYDEFLKITNEYGDPCFCDSLRLKLNGHKNTLVLNTVPVLIAVDEIENAMSNITSHYRDEPRFRAILTRVQEINKLYIIDPRRCYSNYVPKDELKRTIETLFIAPDPMSYSNGSHSRLMQWFREKIVKPIQATLFANHLVSTKQTFFASKTETMMMTIKENLQKDNTINNFYPK